MSARIAAIVFQALYVILCIPAAGSAQAADSSAVQKLDTRRSNLSFSLSNQAVDLDGRLTAYSGSLQIKPEKIEESIVNLSIDISSAEIEADSPAQTVLLQSLIRSFPAPRGTFRSTKAVKTSGGSWLLQGVFTRGAETRDVSFPVRINIVSPLLTEMIADISGDIWNSELPPQFNFLEGRARVKGKLVFSRS